MSISNDRFGLDFEEATIPSPIVCTAPSVLPAAGQVAGVATKTPRVVDVDGTVVPPPPPPLIPVFLLPLLGVLTRLPPLPPR